MVVVVVLRQGRNTPRVDVDLRFHCCRASNPAANEDAGISPFNFYHVSAPSISASELLLHAATLPLRCAGHKHAVQTCLQELVAGAQPEFELRIRAEAGTRSIDGRTQRRVDALRDRDMGFLELSTIRISGKFQEGAGTLTSL